MVRLGGRMRTGEILRVQKSWHSRPCTSVQAKNRMGQIGGQGNYERDEGPSGSGRLVPQCGFDTLRPGSHQWVDPAVRIIARIRSLAE
jgi:hypothetical protein